eukprot:606710-Prorocentrum_lima.AAC.1
MFAPWAKGASLVAEMQIGDGSWEAFMADRFPEQLDDELKKVQKFYLAAKHSEPEELLETLP